MVTLFFSLIKPESFLPFTELLSRSDKDHDVKGIDLAVCAMHQTLNL